MRVRAGEGCLRHTAVRKIAPGKARARRATGVATVTRELRPRGGRGLLGERGGCPEGEGFRPCLSSPVAFLVGFPFAAPTTPGQFEPTQAKGLMKRTRRQANKLGTLKITA